MVATPPSLRGGASKNFQKPSSGKAKPFRTSGGKAATDDLVSERLARLQHMRDPILRLARANQRKKSFAFQIEKVLLGYFRGVIQIAARQNARQLLANQCVVIRNIARSLHQVNA